jgi:aspartyl-tRNA(Asn)/glutamyl-tRNA(Gln) amidotransferase subunit A
LYGESARLRIAGGALISGDDYVAAQRHRGRLIAQMAEVMGTVDVLVMPTWAEPARLFEGDDSLLFPATFTMPFNVTGNPALSVCSGFSAAGLPLSMQIVGRPFEDALVLRVGDAFEKATGFRAVRPTLSLPHAAAA